MLVVVHHVYQAYSIMPRSFLSFLRESIIFLRSWNQDGPIIMKIFIFKPFSGSPWKPITSFYCEETISLLDWHYAKKKKLEPESSAYLLVGLQSFRCRLIGINLLDLLSPSPPLRIQLVEVSVQSLLSPCDRTSKCFWFVHEVCAVNVIILS